MRRVWSGLKLVLKKRYRRGCSFMSGLNFHIVLNYISSICDFNVFSLLLALMCPQIRTLSERYCVSSFLHSFQNPKDSSCINNMISSVIAKDVPLDYWTVVWVSYDHIWTLWISQCYHILKLQTKLRTFGRRKNSEVYYR